MRYDISIIGGGPAGAMAALAASRRGAKTILIDDKQPGVPYVSACAEGVGDAVLKSLGLSEGPWVMNRCHNIKITAPNGTTRVLAPKGLTALVLDRAAFEASLIAQASEYPNFNYSPGYRATSISGHKSGINYWKTLDVQSIQTGEIEKVDSLIVIDCSGIRATIAKQAGLYMPPLKRSDIGVCSQYRVLSPELDEDTFELWFGSKYGAPRGYIWVFPKTSCYSNVGIGVPGGQGVDTKKNLEEFINWRFGRYAEFRSHYIRASIPLAPPLRQVSTPDGIMVAGDAARFCISTTGAGIGMALWSGREAGAVAANHLKGHLPLSHYDDICHKTIIPKLERAYRLKNRVTKSDESMQRYFYALQPLLWLHNVAPRWVEKRAARNMRFA